MSTLVPPPIIRKSCRWIEMVCAGNHPMDSENKVVLSLHTILVGYYCFAPSAGREASRLLCFSGTYVGSYFNWYTPEYVFDSTAVGKATEICMEVSGWKYIFPTGDCVSCTHNLMGCRVYWTTGIFNNSQESYVIAEIFPHCFGKNYFVKWNPRFNIHMKRLLSFLILELLLRLSVLMITLIFCGS